MLIELYILVAIAFLFGTVVGAGIVCYIQDTTPKFAKKPEPLTAFGARPATDADFELVRRFLESEGK